jgi:Tfp pilus assembly protein FimV
MAIRKEDLAHEAVVVAFPSRVAERPRRAAMLHRRRRTLAVLGAASVFVATLLGGGSDGIAPASMERAPRRVVVRSGDTIWRLAERYAPTSVDRRAYVDAIVELNGLEGPLPAGRGIKLPE